MDTAMDLILWRHAEAEDGIPDSARELTKRGRKQAAQIAAWLKTRIPADCAILVSPSKRTQQTADALGLPYETNKKVGTGAAPDEILAAAGWPEREGTVLVVGHQPTLGGVAALILCGEESDWTVKKAAVWWFSCSARHGGDIVLRAVVCPDLV
jgi:phosphohistidine phosphatase